MDIFGAGTKESVCVSYTIKKTPQTLQNVM